MPSPLPLTITNSPLPEGVDFTPQQLFDAMVARLSIETQDALALFSSGSVQPTSNTGPWLKNGQTWYVWDNGTGSYIPQIIDFQSLRYIASVAAPDHTKYVLWIQIDGSGKPLAIKYYYSGAWTDIYADTLASYATLSAMNAAIAAGNKRYPAAAKLSGAQTFVVDGSFVKILFSQSILNPDAVYNAAQSKYVAPVSGVYRANYSLQIDNVDGVLSGMEFGAKIAVNGSVGDPLAPSSGVSIASPPGDRWYPQTGGLVSLSAGDVIEAWITGFDGTGTGSVSIAPQSQFFIELVQKT